MQTSHYTLYPIRINPYPFQANSAFHPSRVGKWEPASGGKAKAGMVHSVNGCTRGVQVKLWDPLRTCAIPERLVFMTRRYSNPRLPLPYTVLTRRSFNYMCLLKCRSDQSNTLDGPTHKQHSRKQKILTITAFYPVTVILPRVPNIWMDCNVNHDIYQHVW